MKKASETKRHTITVTLNPLAWETLLALRLKMANPSLPVLVSPTAVAGALLYHGLVEACKLWDVKKPLALFALD